MTDKSSFFALVMSFGLLLSCGTKNRNIIKLPDHVQAVSLIGDSLYTRHVDLPEVLELRINTFIDAAEADNNDMATMLIWQARKQGYQGEYRKAVETLTAAISQYPNDARMYRHRGHRYITLRLFDAAIADLEKAAELESGKTDRTEPDGAPNAKDIPTSTLQTNIWYHLGLAYYLQGNFTKALEAYENCLILSKNSDMQIATKYWMYMTLRKLGKDEEAGKLINSVTADLELIENTSYHKLLLVFKGEFDEKALLGEENEALDVVTYGYGLGFWHAINGREQKAAELWQQTYDTQNWAPFGFIASEAELARKVKN